MWHVLGGRDMNTGFWQENLGEGDKLDKYTHMAVNVTIKQ